MVETKAQSKVRRLTRSIDEAEVSAERAAARRLLADFNRCAEGYHMRDVIDAATTVLAVAVASHAGGARMSEAQTQKFARACCRNVLARTAMAWHATVTADDLKIRPN
jgi:hypothetical protein